MELERLREFLIISEEGSLKNAAEKIGVAPNVLSARFSTFEKSIGSQLLHRDAHGISLTENGAILLQNARDLIDSYDRSILALQSTSNDTYRSLKLQFCALGMAPELGIFLDKYCRRYPRLYLDLLDNTSVSIREGLSTGNIDIAVANGRENDFLDISGRLVVAHFPTINIYVANDHPLANKQHVSFSDLDGETFVLYPETEENCIRDLQLSLLQQSGISYEVYNANCTPHFYDLYVPMGKGIMFTPTDFHTPPNSHMITISDKGYDTYTYLLFNKDSQNETAMEFLEGYQTLLGGHK